MWTRSPASRRPSPSARKTPRAIRAPRSPLPPRSTIFCACSTRAPAAAIAPSAATRAARHRGSGRAAHARAARKARAGTRCFPCGWAAEPDALRDHLFELRKKGFNRLFQNGRVFEFSTPESLLDIDFTQPVFILVDRFVISPDLHQRIVDTVEICYREAGEVIFEEATPQDPPPATLRFSEKFACKRCGIELVTPEPGLFSFNNPMGACPRCQGFGNTIDYDMDLVIPEPRPVARRRRRRSLDQAAIRMRFGCTSRRRSRGKVRWNVPFCDLTAGRAGHRSSKAIHDFFADWKPRSTRCTCASS